MRSLALAALLATSGCAAVSDQIACRHVAGREPGAAFGLLGLVGVIVQAGDAGHRVWQDTVDACVRTKEIARR